MTRFAKRLTNHRYKRLKRVDCIAKNPSVFSGILWSVVEDCFDHSINDNFAHFGATISARRLWDGGDSANFYSMVRAMIVWAVKLFYHGNPLFLLVIEMLCEIVVYVDLAVIFYSESLWYLIGKIRLFLCREAFLR